uniref:Uncharacterized protein n=1 Tax=Steinernema glaseri TaxID=37863 RepID=A0A1I7Y4G1_9BILA
MNKCRRNLHGAVARVTKIRRWRRDPSTEYLYLREISESTHGLIALTESIETGIAIYDLCLFRVPPVSLTDEVESDDCSHPTKAIPVQGMPTLVLLLLHGPFRSFASLSTPCFAQHRSGAIVTQPRLGRSPRARWAHSSHDAPRRIVASSEAQTSLLASFALLGRPHGPPEEEGHSPPGFYDSLDAVRFQSKRLANQRSSSRELAATTQAKTELKSPPGFYDSLDAVRFESKRLANRRRSSRELAATIHTKTELKTPETPTNGRYRKSHTFKKRNKKQLLLKVESCGDALDRPRITS